MPEPMRHHAFVARPGGFCAVCRLPARNRVHSQHVDEPLARVLLERAQDGYVNPTGGKTTGRERKDD